MRTGSWSERIFLLFLLGLVCHGLLLVVQRRLPQLGNGGLVQLAFDLGGEPKAKDPSGISTFCGTSDPAPIRQLLPTFAPFSTMAPMPMRVLSPTVHPWRMAPWPTVTFSPTVTGWS